MKIWEMAKAVNVFLFVMTTKKRNCVRYTITPIFTMMTYFVTVVG